MKPVSCLYSHCTATGPDDQKLEEMQYCSELNETFIIAYFGARVTKSNAIPYKMDKLFHAPEIHTKFLIGWTFCNSASAVLKTTYASFKVVIITDFGQKQKSA